MDTTLGLLVLIYVITRNWFGLDIAFLYASIHRKVFLVEEKVSIAEGWVGALYRPDGVGPALIIVDGKSKPEGRSTLH